MTTNPLTQPTPAFTGDRFAAELRAKADHLWTAAEQCVDQAYELRVQAAELDTKALEFKARAEAYTHLATQVATS